MQFHYFFTMRQADTRTFIFCPGMQSLKNDKYFFIMFFFYADTIICK